MLEILSKILLSISLLKYKPQKQRVERWKEFPFCLSFGEKSSERIIKIRLFFSLC